ncbi:MAG: FGGY-family carbohydrate kinase [Candidatus Bathyarchaeia archaeon]
MVNFLLGVDIGTSSVKSSLIDFNGNMIHEASVLMPPVDVKGSEAEYDPEIWWKSFKSLLLEVKQNISLEKIKAVCVCGQGPSLVAIDKNGRPIHKSLIWMDRRAVEESEIIKQRTGDSADPYLFEPKILWLKNHKPEIYEKSFKFLNSYDFISYRLTKRGCTGVLRKNYLPWWNIPYWSIEHLEALGIELSKMPEPLLVGEVIGRITPEAAEETGLSKDTVLVQGVTDFAHDILGSGAVKPGRAMDHGGTSQGFDLCWQEQLNDSKRRILVTKHIVPDYWNISGIMSTTGALLRWFRDNFYQNEVEEAEKEGREAYDKFNEVAADVDVGSAGLIILPYFSGERSPIWDPYARGVIYGLTLSHNKKHLIRAIMESTAYGLKHIMDIINEVGGKVLEVRCVGGQSKSRLWCQIKADVLNVPTLRLRYDSTASLGAAIVGGLGIGVFNGLEEASESVVKIKERFDPNPLNHEKYQNSYRTYRKLYLRLKKLFMESSRLIF